MVAEHEGRRGQARHPHGHRDTQQAEAGSHQNQAHHQVDAGHQHRAQHGGSGVADAALDGADHDHHGLEGGAHGAQGQVGGGHGDDVLGAADQAQDRVRQEDQDEDRDEGGEDGGEHALAAGRVSRGEVAGAEGAGDEGQAPDAHAEEEREGEEHQEVGDAGGGQGFGAQAAGERRVDHEQRALHQVLEHGRPAEREEAAADLGEGQLGRARNGGRCDRGRGRQRAAPELCGGQSDLGGFYGGTGWLGG